MRLKSMIIGTVIISSTVLGLTGCGKSGANQVNEGKISILKDAQSSNQRIWFSVDDGESGNHQLNKNSVIGTAYVTQNGKVTAYHTKYKGVSFKDIEGKTDNELITLFKRWDKTFLADYWKEDQKSLNDQIKKEKSYVDSDKRSLKAMQARYKEKIGLDKSAVDESKEELSRGKSMLEYYQSVSKQFKSKKPKYVLPTTSKLSAEVTTDNSGNNVETEKILYKTHGYQALEPDENDHSNTIYPSYFLGQGEVKLQSTYSAPVKIFNEMYTGYTGTTDNKNYYLVTRTTNKNATVDFDGVKTKGVRVTDY